MPFICSLSGDNGIMGCHEIPPLKEQGRECCLSKDDMYDFGAGRQDLNASGLCVNWNRYYNVCRTGNANPHKGAINFDNIGYAWIAIFQVGPHGPWDVAQNSHRTLHNLGVLILRVRVVTRGAEQTGGDFSGASQSQPSLLPPQVITLEGWVDIMYFVMDAHSFYNFIYFILLIIVSDSSSLRGSGASWRHG